VAENGRQEWYGTAYGPVAKSARCLGVRKRALEAIVQLAVELAREGREGRKIGTLFVIGDVENVLARSRSLLLDPLHGHPAEVLHADLPDFRETVKELAQLDGAFVVDDDGTFVSAGRFIDVDLTPQNFLPGLGTRHAAAASVTRETHATAVAVSQSSVVRVFGHGEVRAEIIPELFLMSKDGLFTRSAEVSQVPELGVTLAVAGEAG
jgi:DNA integrity scanning protein DisA with diadenylate cyclase activity